MHKLIRIFVKFRIKTFNRIHFICNFQDLLHTQMQLLEGQLYTASIMAKLFIPTLQARFVCKPIPQWQTYLILKLSSGWKKNCRFIQTLHLNSQDTPIYFYFLFRFYCVFSIYYVYLYYLLFIMFETFASMFNIIILGII